MIYLHPHTKHILTHVTDKAQSVRHPFWLLRGPQGMGKMERVEEYVSETVQEYSQSDSLFIRDYSTALGKTHTLKVARTDSGVTTQVEKDFSYRDRGVREMNEWLARSPAGSRKILVIENIERMSIGAANALLKNIEEPLPGRIIIATTSHSARVLPTIHSRAFLVPFLPLDNQSMLAICEEHDISTELAQRMICIAGGSPTHLLEYIESEKENDEQSLWGKRKKFLSLRQGSSLYAVYTLLQEIWKQGHEARWWEIIHRDALSRKAYSETYAYIDLQHFTHANVASDNVLWTLARVCHRPV